MTPSPPKPMRKSRPTAHRAPSPETSTLPDESATGAMRASPPVVTVAPPVTSMRVALVPPIVNKLPVATPDAGPSTVIVPTTTSELATDIVPPAQTATLPAPPFTYTCAPGPSNATADPGPVIV